MREIGVGAYAPTPYSRGISNYNITITDFDSVYCNSPS